MEEGRGTRDEGRRKRDEGAGAERASSRKHGKTQRQDKGRHQVKAQEERRRKQEPGSMNQEWHGRGTVEARLRHS